MGRMKRIWVAIKENPAIRSWFAFVTPGSPRWTPDNYAALTEAGYENCATVFACVRLIATTASRIGWTLAKGDNEFDTHPLLDLLARPNEFEGGIRLTEKVFSYLLLSGNSYLTKVHGVQSSPPSFLYALRPDRMKIVPSKNWMKPIGHYEYNAGVAVDFKTEDILHLTEFHPLEDWYGLSRLRVAARQIDISNEAAEWNKKLLQNDMRPSGGYKVQTTLTDDQYKRLKSEIEYKSAGYENAGKFLLLEGGADWVPMSMNAKDVDWLNGQKYVMRQICAIFGVPSQLLGDGEYTTYANYQEARKALYQETILPLMDIYREELNAWLVPLYGKGLKLDYDRDSIEALQEDQAKKYGYINAAGFLTINEKREATGYDDIGPDGDVIMVPFSETPLEQAVKEPEPIPDALVGAGADDDDDEPKQKRAKQPTKGYWQAPERKELLWKNFEARVKAKERPFAAEVEKFLKGEIDDIAAKIGAFPVPAAVSASQVFDAYESARSFASKFERRYLWMFIRAGEAGLHVSNGKLFDPIEDMKAGSFVLTDDLKAKLRDLVLNSGRFIGEETAAKVQAMIDKGIADDWTVDELTREVRAKLEDLSISRSRLISRTETAKVENYGTLEGMKSSEFAERKGWLCSFVPNSREDHIKADVDYSNNTIPLDEPFIVGGQPMQYPGDPAGGAAEVCNCLCSLFSETADLGD